MVEPTSEERDLIHLFRSRISDLQPLLEENQQHDQNLLRWIRAREGDLSKSEDMLRRHIEWRKNIGIGPSLLDWKPSSFLTDTYCAKFCGYDVDGSPILFFPFGGWDLRLALSRDEKENVIRYKDKCLEQVMRLMQLYEVQRQLHSHLSTRPEKVTQFACICDWQGFSLRYIMRKEVVEVILEAARSFEANYPETLKAAYNVNCPKVFDVLFKLVKPFLNERTLSKIFIYDNNENKWKSDILKNLPIDQVPLRYGGTREVLWDVTNLNYDLNQDGSFFDEIFPNSSRKSEGFESKENEGFKQVQVPSYEKVSVPVLIVSPKTSLSWNVKCEQEIDVTVAYENGGCDRKICVERTSILTDSGHVHCCQTGNYWVIFSNSSTETNEPKTVYYKLNLDVCENPV